MRIKLTPVALAAVFGLSCSALTLPQTAAAQSAPAGKEMSSTAPAGAKMAKKRAPSKSVMALQEALNKHGAKLNVDGQMGKKTRDALKSFQTANGLKASGRADKATRQKLGI